MSILAKRIKCIKLTIKIPFFFELFLYRYPKKDVKAFYHALGRFFAAALYLQRFVSFSHDKWGIFDQSKDDRPSMDVYEWKLLHKAAGVSLVL